MTAGELTVVGLYTAPSAGEAMVPGAEVVVTKDRGIDGDRYSAGTGHWSDPQWPDQQLTLIDVETADALGIEPALLRRNVVTRGGRLADLIGCDVRIGSAVLRFVRPCDPCGYLETLLDRPGLRAALENRGGVRAAVIAGGTISVGDSLEAMTA